MKLLPILVLAAVLDACAVAPAPKPAPKATATAPSYAPAELVREAYSIDSEYVATLARALKQVRTPGLDRRVLQGIANSVDDCGRVFDQLEKAAADPTSTNLKQWLERAEQSLANLHAMMEAKPP